MRLAVTKNIDELAFLEGPAAEHQVELVALPLSRVEPVMFDWPTGPKLAEIDWLTFSSANGVRSFFERLRELGLTVADRTKIAVVGERTAAVLKQISGRQADLIPHDAYGEMMFQELAQSYQLARQTVLYARAELVNYDPEQLLKKLKVNYIPLVSYRSVQQEPDADLVRQLEAEDYILFTSPSNVRSYQSQFGRPKTRLIAIGYTTAKSMNEAGWSGFAIMKAKNVETVLELI